MANWHYYNKNGDKVGPISVAALKALTQQGLITRETIIENHTGRTAVAGEINGLVFPERTQPEKVEAEIPPKPVTIDDTEPSTVSPEPGAAVAMQFGNVPIHTVPAPEQSEVYGVSTPKSEPKSTPSVEANPFTIAETNPFTAAQPLPKPKPPVVEEVNPFTAASPEKSNPFAGISPTESRKRSKPEPSSKTTDAAKGLPKSILFAGIAVILLVLLIGFFIGGPKLRQADEAAMEPGKRAICMSNIGVIVRALHD